MAEVTEPTNPNPVPAGEPPTAAAAVVLDRAADDRTGNAGPTAVDEDGIPRRPLAWLGMMVAAAAVGAAVGAVGAAFQLALRDADRWRAAMLAWSHGHGHGVGWLIPVGLCGAAAAAGAYLTERFAPSTAGSGIPRIEAVLRNHLRPATALILPIKFVGGVLSIGSGMALGREGPTVQMGGTVGRLFSDATRRLTPEPWTLTAAGAGAGLAVAFNAPLAAALFVAEELIHRFSARIFAATLVATIAGTLVSQRMLGTGTDFHVVIGALPTPAAELPEYAVLGLIAGLFGVAFNVSLLWAMDAYAAAARRWPKGTRGALVGVAVGLMAWWRPHAVGGGEGVAQAALDHREVWPVVGVLLVVRFGLTLASYSSGAPGGIFAPLLALGAIVGAIFTDGMAALGHRAGDGPAFGVVAMAACFTAVVRSPLTAVVLVLEMTGAWMLILPMMAASVCAYAVPELLGNRPVYDSLRDRDEAVERARRSVA